MRISDWSSDVCSSDLTSATAVPRICGHSWEVSSCRSAGGGGSASGPPSGWWSAGSCSNSLRMSSIDGMRGSGSAKGHLHVVACFRIRVVPHQRLAHQLAQRDVERSEEHTSELQSLMRISYAVFCLKKKK